MPKALKDRVKDAMTQYNVSMLELSRQTGIPSNRMYKWYQQGTQPKADDAEALEKWLNTLDISTNKNSNNSAEAPAHTDGNRQPLLETILNLSYANRKSADSVDKIADANLINARSMETLVLILAANLNLNKESLKGLSLEALQRGDVPAEAFLGGRPLEKQQDTPVDNTKKRERK